MDSLKEVTPIGSNIKIKLPDFFKTRERKTESGIYVPHLEGKFEHDITHGTVTAVGDSVTMCKVGDEVFFSSLYIQAGLQNMGNDPTRPDAKKDTGSGVPVFYLADSDNHYLFMPEDRKYLLASDWSGEHEAEIHGGVICAVRDGQVICFNGYHIMKDGYEKPELVDGVLTRKTESGIVIAVLREEEEKNKRFIVMYSPEDSWVKPDDLIFTRPHCDIKLEGDFNYPMFPKGTYYVRKDDILCVIDGPVMIPNE